MTGKGFTVRRGGALGKKSARGAGEPLRRAARHLTSQEAAFKVGDSVRSKPGVYRGDGTAMPVGTPGRVVSVAQHTPPLFIVEFEKFGTSKVPAGLLELVGEAAVPEGGLLTAQHPPTGELPPLKKGTIVYSNGWPAIVMENTRRKHNTRIEAVLCEVWGYAHECGSAYRKDIYPALSMDVWKNDVKKWGGDPEDRYFKGDLMIATPEQGQVFRVMQADEFPPLAKGTIVYNIAGWPAIVAEATRRKHNTAMEPIFCEVWGWHHEMGSVYRKELIPALSMDQWKNDVRKMNGDPDDRYFKGDLIIADPDQHQLYRVMQKEVTAVSKSEIYQMILDETVGRGHGVLTGPKIHPDIPDLADAARWPYHSSVEHLGFGFFKGETPSGEFHFDGGGAMRRATDDEGNYVSWTPLVANSAVLSDLGYDLGAVERALVGLIGEG